MKADETKQEGEGRRQEEMRRAEEWQGKPKIQEETRREPIRGEQSRGYGQDRGEDGRGEAEDQDLR